LNWLKLKGISIDTLPPCDFLPYTQSESTLTVLHIS